ncbi:hypothetical protein AMTRI_Chr13g121760 [Amborella trichopoda]
MDELRTLFMCAVWVMVSSVTTIQMCTRNDCGLSYDLKFCGVHCYWIDDCK